MEDQPIRRSRRLKILPPLITLEPPPSPQRRRLDIDGSFELKGLSEVPSEPELRANRFYFNTVEIEDLQANEFARNFNTPLTDLNDPVIVQVRTFDSPMLGVPVGRIMSSTKESPFVFTSTLLVEGVLPPPVSAPRSSLPSTPLTPASRVVQPPVHSNLGGTSSDMVTGIPSIPTIPYSFPYTTQSSPVGSSAFVQGFPWNGGHIPPSIPYVGPSPSYVGVQFGSNTSYRKSFQTPISVPYTSSPFSLFSGGIPAPVFRPLLLWG